MSIGGILVLTQKGDVLVSKFFRDNIGSHRGVSEAFRLKVICAKEVRSPIDSISNINFMHIKQEDLYVVAVTTANVDACLVFEVLYSFVNLVKKYTGRFDDESLRRNFILAYEVLEEILDYGYPQSSDTETLKPFITQRGKGLKKLRADRASKITIQATGAISWRSPDIKYKKNEIYIDVIESVNLLMSAQGNILNAHIAGQIQMKCYLTGMPDCQFGMNDKIPIDHGIKSERAPRGGVELNDVNFHHCVRLTKFESDREISFIPPDGEFELMKYRTTEIRQENLPFTIISHVNEIGRARIEVEITVTSNFAPKLTGVHVKIVIPTPKNTAVCRTIIKGGGKASYNSDIGGILWKIAKFPGRSKFLLRANIQLIQNISVEQKAWSRPPISMEFQVPMMTASGMQVKFLRVVEKSGYTTIKWVRYLTKAGNYLYRI
eukprot:TRINITY_DN6187_c0_g1_i1.p1 TRINITY_DN6187_c0_g1~~TRINITY_DN6187_c0_g1_i1.p1  ORF type:complete len:435 (-),score=57.60 TRINITY_DN6187_c0_g1_i1:46-1350(-)